MIIYLVMVDLDGMMRSSCDSPVSAFKTEQAAKDYIKNNTINNCVCGGYRAEIITTNLEE